jgi:uncharacterized membrane protein
MWYLTVVLQKTMLLKASTNVLEVLGSLLIDFIGATDEDALQNDDSQHRNNLTHES